jgi:macrolide-specific efflux system membrane fusion protein
MTAPSSTPHAPWRRRFVNRYSLGALALLLAAGAYWAWQHAGGSKSAREQYNIATVQRGDLQDLVTATGTVQPRDYVDVGAQVSGQLKKLHVEVGSIVKQGDLLAEIDPTVLTANVEARRAGLRNQQATLKDREAQLALAQIQFQRQKNLAAEDATTAEQLQQAEAALRSARAQLDAVKAQIEQTQSTLRADEANLNYARIYAPMAGTVVTVTARQGQTLNANQQAPVLLRIADLSTMTVQTQVSEADVSKLRQGMEVYFTTLGSQGRRWTSRLRKVEPTPTVTNNVVLYNALFDVPNANQQLMSNMTAQVFFVAAQADDVLLVPVAAVQRSGQRGGDSREGRAEGSGRGSAVAVSAERPRAAPEPASAASSPRPPVSAGFAASSASPRGPRKGTVKVIDAEGRIEERAVELGISNRVQVQVLAGLKEGEQVIAGMKAPAGAAAAGGGARGGAGGLPGGGFGGAPGGGLGGAGGGARGGR